MQIVIKELQNEDHIYLMDVNQRPITIDIVGKNETRSALTDLILKHNVSNLSVGTHLDYSQNEDYFQDNL